MLRIGRLPLRLGGQSSRNAVTLSEALHIGGQNVPASDGNTATVYDPAHLTPIGNVAMATVDDVNKAVECAHHAFIDGRWSGLPPRTRARALFKTADLLRENLAEIAELESRQTGRSLREYRAQLGRVPEWFEYHASLAASSGLEGRMPSLVEQDHVNLVRRVPIGVCGLITPWNHPLLIAVKKISVALAAGNTIVVKPPELAPFTVLRLARLLEEAGVPPGVCNVVPGSGPIAGEAIAKHLLVERVDFTGGTKTGVQIQSAIAKAGKVKPFCAELGGNAPVLVFDDADVSAAVNGVAFAAFVASGQTCVSAKRILVHEPIYGAFLTALVDKANGLVLGNPLDANTDIGPVISARQLETIEGMVTRSFQEGAKAAAGGGRPGPDRCSLPGHFFQPTVITGATTDNTAFAEEIFGPVVTVTPFKDEEDAIRLANASKYGLGAAIWTKNVKRSHSVARCLRSGVIWVNCHHRNDPGSPWGGFGESGVGRENGPDALEEYTSSQSITLRLNDTPEDWFGSKAGARYG